MKNNTVTIMMAKILLVLIIGLFLASWITGKSVGQMRQEGGVFKAMENTFQEKTEETANGVFEELARF